MKKRLMMLMVVSLMLVAVLAPAVSAAETDESIVDIAVADGRFDTLVAAVTAADLGDTLSSGKWTVFAPTDAAFAKLGITADNVATGFTKAELSDLLLYHVLKGEVSSDKALTMLGDITMANGRIAGLKYFDGDLYVNDDSKVIIKDIVAENGVIHVVDTVILPPWPRQMADTESTAPAATSDSGSIVDIAMADGRFDTLVAAVVAADLTDTLSSGEWTVFAPTDAAFAKLGLNAKNVASSFTKDELADLLLYHVIKGEVSSDKALTLLGDVTMANGQKAGLKYYKGNLYVNDDSKVIVKDVTADNGVIHAVDTVIMGPWPR